MCAMELPLEGVKVVELSLAIAAPSCGQVLSDYGAEVVKVEPPSGDTQRYMISGLGMSSPDPYKDSPHFYSVNRGKRSIVLDLKTQEGVTTMHALLAKADVFLSNYRYSSMKGLGLDAEKLLARHPHLIVCPMTGWGLEGPEAEKPVYDVAGFWARSGAAHVHTAKDGFPVVLSPGFGDMTTGLAAVGGICAALVQRARTGKGRIVTTNLLRTGLHCNAWAMSSYFAIGRSFKWGERDRTGNPLATVYRAKDGKNFWIIGFEAARHWPPTARALGKPEWINDEKYKSPTARRKVERELVKEMDAIFATKTRDEWGVIFAKEGVWWQPVQDASEVAKDQQALAAGAFLEAPMNEKAKSARTNMTMVAPPVDFLGSKPAGPQRPTPELGEHTAEVVRELGIDAATAAAVIQTSAAAGQPKSKL